MIKIHFRLPDKPDGPVPKVIDSREGTAMWEVGSAAPEGECNINPTYSAENTTYIWNAKLRLKCKMNTFNKSLKMKNENENFCGKK